VGYSLGKKVWGNGYATEALGAALRYARARKFKKVIVIVRPANLRSAKVLPRCGVEFDGAQEDEGKVRDVYVRACAVL
jgi:RimJ/RimL family protein N-acetyltransferase